MRARTHQGPCKEESCVARHITVQKAPDELCLQAVTLAQLAIGKCRWRIVTAGVCLHMLTASLCQFEYRQPGGATYCAIPGPQATEGRLGVTVSAKQRGVGCCGAWTCASALAETCHAHAT